MKNKQDDKRLDKILFKRNRPTIRKTEFFDGVNPGDVPLLWDIYQRGLMPEIPKGIGMDQFLEYSAELDNVLAENYVIEDYVNGALQPVAIVVARNDGWCLEPHVVYLPEASPRVRLRTYTAFLKKTKYRRDIGACLLRVTKATTKLANKMESIGLLEYVGKIWGGRPDGNEYLYSIRCQRRA